MIAGAIANMKSGTRTDLGPIGPRLKSTAEAAAMLNVGVNTVKRAKKVIANAVPILQDMVTGDEVSVSAASDSVRIYGPSTLLRMRKPDCHHRVNLPEMRSARSCIHT